MAKHEFAKPPPHLPAVVRAKKFEELNARIIEQAERQRRLLWLAVDAAGGRIEIDKEAFRMALQGPPEDFYVQTRPEKVYDVKTGRDVEKVVFVFVDKDGKLDPRSAAKKIISTE